MAPTFATWQSIVSDPALDRKLATEVVLFELGMIISGAYFLFSLSIISLSA
jgi:hypothetical protein